MMLFRIPCLIIMVTFAKAQGLKIVISHQNEQTALVKTFEDNLNKFDKSRNEYNVQYSITKVVLNHEEKDRIILCETLKNGVSLILDFTWSGNEVAAHLSNSMGIPYLQPDFSIASVLRLLDTFLNEKNSTDVILIFDNNECKTYLISIPNPTGQGYDRSIAICMWKNVRTDIGISRLVGCGIEITLGRSKEVVKVFLYCVASVIREKKPFSYIDQALYYWIDSTRLRMVVPDKLDRKTVNRLKEIRPIPQSFAIVAATRNMSRLFQQALEGGIVLLPERWNLVFTDFKSSQFDKSVLEDLPVTLISFEEDLCCDLLLKEGCECPQNFNLQSQFVSWIIDAILRSLRTAIEENLEFPSAIECDVSTFPANTKKRFDDILRGNFNESSEVLQGIGSTVFINPRGNIQQNKNGSLIQIATIRDLQIKPVNNQKILPIKAYYRIGITHALPWSFKEQNSETGEWYWTGYCVDVAKKLAEVMNFDFEFVEPTFGTIGAKVNGTWNGVVGDLARGDTDMAITAIMMTADREEVIDFVAPYFEQTGITIVMRKPVRKTSLFKFMTVLKLEVWLSIIAALVVTGFMIWFLDKYSPYSARNNKNAYPYPCREFTLKESFWFALTSFTPQGGGEAPKALSGRTLVAAYWLFVVLMLATFTANLAAFLTVERMQAPVQSLEQLARQSRINYTVVKDSETHKYFINMKNAEDTLYRMWKELTLNASTETSTYRVWDYPIREQYGHILLAINDSNPVRDAAEGFRTVDERLDADFAFIHDSSEVKYEISRNCNFTEVGEVFAEKPYAVAVQQGSHLQDDISKVILDLQKDRFFEQLQEKYWNHSTKGNCPSTDDNEGITLESLGGVFIATLFGLALAMITLAGEVIYYRRKSKRQKENKLSQPPVPQLMGLPPKYGDLKDLKNVSKTITIGSEFKPVNKAKPRDNINISHINLYPRARNRITQVD